MAISKEILNNKKNVKTTNTPKPLGNVPENNPEHVSSPIDFHHPIPPKPILYNSFEEAVKACEQIFLKPGEAHTEFYQKGGSYHCVVAIGNIIPDTKHLYLTDSGNGMSIDDRLDNMVEQVTNLSKQFSLLSKKFDNLNNNVEEFENNVSTALNDIKIAITNFENWKLTIDNSVNQLELKSNQLDSSISELQNLINEFEPIDTSSIRSLFHDDIWTVNLCCYTAGGRIEIFDNVAGEKCGGDNLRVAECTPFNEYKTYVEGDKVSFMAVANEGYKFVNWFYGNSHKIVDYADTSIINLEFGQSDIQVIGTLGENANPSEPAILLYGYSAFFRKLHEVKWSIDTSCNTTQHLIEHFDDKIKVKITEKDRTSKEYIIDNNFTSKIYFDDDAKVEISALPSEDGRHTFEYFVLNEYPEKIYDNQIIITDAKDDVIIDTYFKEWWINIQTEPHPNVADIYVPEGSDKYHLRGDILHINIENLQEGWKFKKWADASISDTELEKYIIEGDLTTPNITVQVDASISSGKYDLIANFTIAYHNITLYDDPNYPTEPYYQINKVPDSSTFSEALNMLPGYIDPSTMGPEYDFVGWEVEHSGYIVYPDHYNRYQITEDTSFYAKYSIKKFNLTFQDNYGYFEQINDISYGETFGYVKTLLKEHPTSPEGYEFDYWATWNGTSYIKIEDTSIIDGTYTIFNAIYKEIKTNYTIGFQTDNGNFILDGTDLVGKTLTYSTSKADDPVLSDASFVGWYDNNGNLLTNTSSYTFEVENENLPLQLNAKFVKYGEGSTIYKKVVENGHIFNDNDLIVIGWQDTKTNLLGASMSGTATQYAISTSINDISDNINVDEKNITTIPAIQKIKLHKNENGNYALEAIDSTGHQTSNLGFYYWTSGNSLSLDESITLENALNNSNYLWSISINNGESAIVNLADTNRKLQYNQSSPRFACYTTQQKIPSIFLLDQPQYTEYMNLGTYKILSAENAFTNNEQIIVTSNTNTALQLNGWNDSTAYIDATRTIIIGDTITSDWVFIPQYGNMYKVKFKTHDNNFTYFEPTAQSDITVDIDGYINNNTIIEGSIGTPTYWINNSIHPGQAQFYTLPFFDSNVEEQWYPSDHWIPVFTTSNYFTNFNKCSLTYCVNTVQTRGGAKIKMVVIDENDNEIAYAYGNGTEEDGIISGENGATLVELTFTNWYYEEDGVIKLYKNTLSNANIMLNGKVRMYLKMNKRSLFITEFAINGSKIEN